MSGLIAIVGRPNVGKSALFNRIAGRRIAIVHDEPGVTRDRISVEAEWRGHPMTLVDTGGIGAVRGEKLHDAIARAAFEQVRLAIDSANVIVLVVNVQDGLVPLDREVAVRLRQSGKPVVLAVNKVDHGAVEADMDEFAALGFERIFPVSAIHGRGVEALMDAAFALLPGSKIEGRESSTETEAHGRVTLDLRPSTIAPLKIAIVGRPNVGKSSIINALTQSERVIVSPIPGTTRDAVDVPFEVDTDGVRQKYVLIDTAGIRKPRRIGDSIEFFSVKRAEESIARCDLAVLVLDAEAGITEQDKKIGGKILEKSKACVIVLNKWDLVEVDMPPGREDAADRQKRRQRHDGRPRRLTTLAEFGRWVQEQLFFLDFAPVIFASARSGFHLDRLLEAVRYVAAQWQQTIPTALLNRALHDAIERRQPVSAAGHRLKFFYATQIKQAPPTFLLFVNRKELLFDAYRKYLSDQLRRAFGYEGCPIELIARPRARTVEPVRKRSLAGSRPDRKR